jgi:hypothetical protein
LAKAELFYSNTSNWKTQRLFIAYTPVWVPAVLEQVAAVLGVAEGPAAAAAAQLQTEMDSTNRARCQKQ